MKQCPICEACYTSIRYECPNCGFHPAALGEFDSYAPELAAGDVGFKEGYFAQLARLEDGHFWFHSRNQLILWFMKNYVPSVQSFIEIGCGTGYVLSGVSRVFPQAKLFGSEIFAKGLSFAKNRVPSAKLIQMDARQIPFLAEFDAVGAFDVLEHIKEDSVVLGQLYKSLKPKGFMLLTVPQHPWLWSPADDHACHVRRYTRLDLHRKIRAAGFHIVRSTSFVTLLLPAMWISRIANRRKSDGKFDALSEFNIPVWLNSLFSKLLYTEFALIKIGINFPAGGSRLVIAQKD